MQNMHSLICWWHYKLESHSGPARARNAGSFFCETPVSSYDDRSWAGIPCHESRDHFKGATRNDHDHRDDLSLGPSACLAVGRRRSGEPEAPGPGCFKFCTAFRQSTNLDAIFIDIRDGSTCHFSIWLLRFDSARMIWQWPAGAAPGPGLGIHCHFAPRKLRQTGPGLPAAGLQQGHFFILCDFWAGPLTRTEALRFSST